MSKNEIHAVSVEQVISSKPEMFAGPKPWGKSLATRLAEDLLLLESMPICIDKIEGWWVVDSSHDRMIDSEGKLALEHFKDLRHYPGAGVNSHKTGPIIAVLCDAVVTMGLDGITWITQK